MSKMRKKHIAMAGRSHYQQHFCKWYLLVFEDGKVLGLNSQGGWDDIKAVGFTAEDVPAMYHERLGL